MKETEQHSFFEDSLRIKYIRLIGIEESCVPMIWVNPGDRTDLAQFSQRQNTIGKLAGLFSQNELHHAYGHSLPHWLYARDRHPNAFFLHLFIVSPGVTISHLHLPFLQIECSIQFDLQEAQTVSLIHALVKAQSFLVRFEGVPSWVKQMPPLRIDEQGLNMSDQIEQLLLTSFPVTFAAAGIELIKRLVDDWESDRNK